MKNDGGLRLIKKILPKEKASNEGIIKPKIEVKSQSPDKIKLQNDLIQFYSDHFDVNDLWKVIPKETFSTREFGFDRLDIGFTRNKSFFQSEHLSEYLATFPVAGAYIGSLYKNRLLPADKHQEAITIHNSEWVGRELIFDLDMDEYDQVRVCDCKGKSVCEICWSHMQEAADIIDETLRVDFGFKKLEWVYTGGRGYHCWVLDTKTFYLDQNQRSAIIGYMQLIQDPKGLQKIDPLGNQAELLKRRIYQKLARNFIFNADPKILINEAGFTRTSLQNAKDRLETSTILRDIVDAIPKKKEYIFLQSLIKRHYPRIDHKVTIDVRRLIRMPGSVHIRSKNISEYIEDPVTFNPITDAKNMDEILGN